MANVKYINDTLYVLEREYGDKFILVKTRHVGSDLETGQQVVEKTNLTLKGIILPTDHVRKFFQDIGYLRANSNFTYGGLIDFRDTVIVVRRRHLPPNFDANLNYRVLYNRLAYDAVKFQELHKGIAYILMLKHTEGTLNYNVEDAKVTDNLRIQETQGAE